MKQYPRIKRIVFSIVALSLSLAAALVLSEVAVRLLMPGEHIPAREYDSYLGWRGRPNLKCILHEKNFRIHISQNSRGFRDPERDMGRTDGVHRILCLGDSFTWGWGVEQDQIYTHLLEKMLNSHGVPCDVVNTGVGGYGTDQALLYLEREGQKYAPTLVVYQAAANDLTDNTTIVAEGLYKKPCFRLQEDGSLTLHNEPIPPLTLKERLFYQVSRHSRLAYFLKHRVHARWLWFRSGYGVEELSHDDESPTSAPGYAFRLFCALVVRMNQHCLKNGSALLVLLDFPLTDADRSYWDTHCRGVKAYHVYEYLQTRQNESRRMARIPDDGHWSLFGHQWAAEYLRDQILSLEGFKAKPTDGARYPFSHSGMKSPLPPFRKGG